MLAVRKGRQLRLEVYPAATLDAAILLGAATLGVAPLVQAAGWSAFRGREAAVFVLPRARPSAVPLYVHIATDGVGAEELQFDLGTLEATLESATRQSQVIAAAVGALLAMALAALLIWCVLPDRMFVLYATLFALQALYIAFLSGQGFDWPLLAWATPLSAHAWNVPAALSGAAAGLFVREIADLKRFSPRVYALYGWLALAFVLLAFANLAHLLGFGGRVASLGNVMFLGTAVFTIVVSLLAWRRGSRAAGWFLIAWGLLETATIVTAGGFLLTAEDPWPLAWGLPLSMVAAAVLVALGVADRLREQRLALTEAERRAQTDPLTGVLNRGSLVERLEAACLRVEGFGAPIRLTCSIGVATSDALGVWGEQLISRADAAVYAAKSSGRNQVKVAALAA